MVESEYIKEVVNKVAVQVAMVLMMVLKEKEAVPQLTTVASYREPQRQRYSGPKLKKDWHLTGTHKTATLNF